MEKKIKIVCIVVGILGALATALSFAAEVKRIQGYQIRYAPPDKCTYPRSLAVALALTASVALTIAQIIINVATGCLCCTTRSVYFNLRQTMALICSIFSWFTFLAAILFLLVGAALNDNRAEQSAFMANYYCKAVSGGLFTFAAILSIATVVLGILSYTVIESEEDRGDAWAPSDVTEQQPAIAMGQPQFPLERSHDPMFVHEDTYTRLQVAA